MNEYLYMCPNCGKEKWTTLIQIIRCNKCEYEMIKMQKAFIDYKKKIGEIPKCKN